ncbi:hypothetical protein [Ramlibacter tataouinensis]|uniref:Ribosomal subunit interface protein n=1 Tax=Ramlibacter tataouinensis (strain ATCC BAA-407 / DSM 14655 / LMG 21543 / TTB310) TaxID=365046 RepID=F5XYJ9_RAMTT|nr:hypothetical protein [Ramlibacter tataouinensis]AEG93175.1 hypothetical protein Rta_20810 [Ramlibacter tataouinensis TTB310]
MNVEIRATELKLTVRQRADAAARVRAAFARLAHRVSRVVVDLRGAGAHKSRRCAVEVHIPGEAPVLVEDRHVNVAALVRRALARAWRAAIARVAALAARRPIHHLPAPVRQAPWK